MRSDRKYLWLRLKQDWIKKPFPEAKRKVLNSSGCPVPGPFTSLDSHSHLVVSVSHTLSASLRGRHDCCPHFCRSGPKAASDRPGLERSALNPGLCPHQSLCAPRAHVIHHHRTPRWRTREESGFGTTRVCSLAATRLIPRAAKEDCSSQGFCWNDKGRAGGGGQTGRNKGKKGAETGPLAAPDTSNPAPASHFPKVAPGCFLLQLASCQRFH